MYCSFKAHLHSEQLLPNGYYRHPLPAKKAVEAVLGDFLRHINHSTRYYIEETHPDDPAIWRSFKDDIDFILTHPNGWDATQQAQMIRAATYAGLVPDTSLGHSRIHFMTEGEANLQYCINDNSVSQVTKVGLTTCVELPSNLVFSSEWRRLHHR